MTELIVDGEMSDFHLRWSKLSAPQRPTRQVAQLMQSLLAERPGPALQLGVTPEIARASAHGVAVDYNPEMIRIAWPGDIDTHRAVLGNWLQLELPEASFTTAFGDGSLTMLHYDEEYPLLFENLERVFRPGGRLVLRCFATPENNETLEMVAISALAGENRSFGEFKLRLNMAVVRDAGMVSVTSGRIHEAFQQLFPDREATARQTGWTTEDFDHFDAYKDAPSLHSYPTRAQIAAALPEGCSHRFIETDGYPLAERCPILVVDFPKK